MANILNLENITKVLGTRTVLDNVTVGISDHDKIGVIGVNGTGKSTLLTIAAGIMEPDQGQVIKNNGLKIAYLPQAPEFNTGKSLLENVAEMAYGKNAGQTHNGEVVAMLGKFGINDPSVNPEILSGGQKKRAALAAAVLASSDLLILDEPTNHLDIEMIEWLENFLQHYRGAILMVTHDRYFLDEVSNQILEIDRGKTYRYEENYSGFLELKQQRLDYEIAAERKKAALFKKDVTWMLRGARARSTKQKAHIQRFEELRDRDKIVEERQVQINSAGTRLGNKTIEVENISKSFGDHTLFHDFSYNFLRTDRIGIIGSNGCGKSTLIKILTNNLRPDTGKVEIGQTVKISYFSQENEELDESQRVIDYIKDTAELIRTSDGLVSASQMCERFLFEGPMQYTPISKLSGGEKRRLYLLHVLMESPNVLILDEPTNDLDISTLQILEDYLDSFAGIIIVVSHDRYFLDRVVTRIFSFEGDGVLHQSEGGYEDYLEHTGKNVNGTTDSGSAKSSSSGELSDGSDNETTNKNNWKQNQPERKKKKLSFKEQKEYDTIEEEIDKLQTRSDEIDAEIPKAATDFVKLQELTAEKARVEQELEEKMERYIELQDMVDSFEQ